MRGKNGAKLRKVLRETIKNHKRIIVLGWMDRNHDCATRNISDRLVRFYKEPPDDFGATAGYVIFTRFVSHSAIERARKMLPGRVHRIPLDLDDLRRALLAVCSTVQNTAAAELASAALEPARPDTDASHQDRIISIAVNLLEEKKVDALSQFVAAFLEAANGEGLVGSRTLGNIMQNCRLTKKTKQLVSEGWIIPQTQAGKTKIGWYRAGPKMRSPEALEPQDPIERARFYIEKRRPQLLAERDKVQEMLHSINGELEKIDYLENNFREIEKTVEELRPDKE